MISITVQGRDDKSRKYNTTNTTRDWTMIDASHWPFLRIFNAYTLVFLLFSLVSKHIIMSDKDDVADLADDVDETWMTDNEDEEDDDEIAEKEIGMPEQDVLEQDQGRHHAKSVRFGPYVHEVLRMIHPDLGISRKGMCVVESMLNDIFDYLLAIAAQKARDAHRSTIFPGDVQEAVRQAIPGALGRHGMSEGMKALFKYGEHYPEIKTM